ncbi:hypothetical protein NUW58_g6443 [Xylaria curta]|uniref:Uncharacterized protein n=1 Tax=Xylaria curta TaxID=42375 RepID=A0ACC1NTN6_9PEZI|nr:hypothetical protein NUW58_g6443 [Xylaria curta]
MASEEPQSRPLESKTTEPNPAEDMEVDEPATKTVEGGAKPNGESVQSETTPITNGFTPKSVQPVDDAVKSHQNDEPSTTNSNSEDSVPPKSVVDPPPTEDAEMTEVNGTAEAEEKQPEEKTDDNVDAHTSSNKASEEPDKADVEATALRDAPPEESKVLRKDSDADGPIIDPTADSMDIDPSIEAPDLASSADHGESTQNTSAVSDAPIVSSPPGSSQPADLSKLEIKATQEEENLSPTQADVHMAEAISLPPKIPRGREEDDPEEPAAKRAKTEDASEETTDSLVVASNTDADTPAEQPGSLGSAIPDSLPITPHQNKRTREVLGNVKKTKNGGNFRKSVQDLWPGLWNDYRAKIDNPVDISSMEVKLREDKYATYGEFKADVNQLYENAVLFNGLQHDVTLAAAQVRDYILVRMPEIIYSKSTHQTRERQGPTNSTRGTSSRNPTTPPVSLADTCTGSKSENQDRAISHFRDSFIYSPSLCYPPPLAFLKFDVILRGKTMTGQSDQSIPQRTVTPKEVKKTKYYGINQWFLAAVDPVALNIPNYFKIIKKPMDLATMTEKNYDGEYKTMKDLEKDMKLLVHNSELFNGLDHEVTNQARQLEDLLKTQLAGKDKWMERHYPSVTSSAMHASAASPERSIVESDEESEGDGEEDNDAILGLQQRLNEEQDKLNEMLVSKKPDLTMVEVQQQMVSLLQRSLLQERAKFRSEKKPKKKKTASSKSKSKTGGGSSLGGNKRPGGSVSTSKKPLGSSKKPPAPKKRTIGALEKAVIAEGINELDGNTLTKAVEIIKRDTGQNENDDGEMELDIDSLTVDALGKLYDLINKAHPNIRQTLAKKPEYNSVVSSEPEPKVKPGGLPKAKKNKPMNKIEQERKIEQLRELKAQLQRHGSGSQEPIPEVEAPAAAESSESSDSEEE